MNRTQGKLNNIFNRLTIRTLILAVVFSGIGFVSMTSTAAQTRPRATRVNDAQVERIIRSVERRSDAFRRSFDAAMDRSRLDGTFTEDELNDRVKSFEEATNNLRSRFNGRQAAGSDVENVLNRAAAIDQFMRSNLKQRRVQGDWTLLKSDLQRLAGAYQVVFDLNGRILPPAVVASQRPYRVSDSQVQYLLNSLETKSDAYRKSLDSALDRSRFNETGLENNINQFVKDFENSTDQLRRNFDNRTSVAADVSSLLARAVQIDDFMKRNLRRESAAQRDWTSLRTDLNQLAGYYGLSYNLDRRAGFPAPADGAATGADGMLTGTYRLNAAAGDDARTLAAGATSTLNNPDRDRIFSNLVSRLEAPEALAVARTGMRVMLASSRSPQVTLDVDNLEHAETYPNGRASPVRTSFNGEALTVVSNGDRANDFTAIFSPLDGGRRLLVTRRVYAERLGQPVEVNSYYERASVLPQYNIYNASNIAVSNGSYSGGPNGVYKF